MPKTKHPIEIYFSNSTRYHFYCFTIMFISNIPIYWHIMDLIFVSPPMKYECETKNEGTKEDCPCDKPKWDKSVFAKTLQTKFNIVCDRTWLISFSQSMLFVSMLIGSLLFGFMSDRYGRLPMFAISCFSLGTAGCLVPAMPTTAAFIFMRCIEGVGIGGAIVTGYVLVVEYCGTKYRDTVTALYHLPLNIGHITLAGISYLVRDVDVLHLVLSVPVFLYVSTKWLIHESPKWLMDNNQIESAAKVMTKIARFNGDKTASVEDIIGKLEKHLTAVNISSPKKLIFRHKNFRWNLVSMAFLYFVCGMGFYGVSQYIGNMSGDIHLNVTVSGLVLMLGTIATTFMLKILSRRMFLTLTNLLSGLLMISAICIPSQLKFSKMIVACIGNGCFFMSFIILFLYSVELFPTTVRNSVLGFLSVLARIGQIAAPKINDLDSFAAGAIFGIAAILGAVICCTLPETKHVDLLSTFKEPKTLPKPKIRLPII